MIDFYDGKDLYTEILNGEDWRVSINIHTIMALIPDFIEASKQMEDQILEQHEVNEAQNMIENKQNND